MPTEDIFRRFQAGDYALKEETQKRMEELATIHRFFHWHLEFPEVFANEGNAGFDCVLGNPPWERIKLQEKEFFAQKDPEIAMAPNAAERKKLIAQLPENNLGLWAEFLEAKRSSEAESHFIRASGKYPLSAVGDINTYQIFAGLDKELISSNGRAGIVIPSGIATDDSNKQFFADLTDKRALVSLYDLENREGIFPAVHRSYKFCLLTVGGGNAAPKGADFAFFLTTVGQLKDEDRHFSLSAEDIALVNPNTRTCPIFRTKRDSEITKAIYQRVPVLIDERKGEEGNPWGIRFTTMFHMANDSQLFRTREQLEDEGWKLKGNIFVQGEARYLPLYEAKMTQPYDHRAADIVISISATIRQGQPESLSIEGHRDCSRLPLPRYWVIESEVESQIGTKRWQLGFTNVTSPTNERSMLPCFIPRVGVGHSMPLIVSPNISKLIELGACLSSIAFDYIGRQKLGGVNYTFFIVKQIPVPWAKDQIRNIIFRRVLELTYTAYDMKSFAEDIWSELHPDLISKPPLPEPFLWNEERRFKIQCELDAIYFHLYGVNRDDVDYIMETFPIVKRKDEQKYGEYRTKRVILECYDAMADAMKTGRPYQTILDPPPADPRIA
ncbi:MAG: SAM-dependent DNA methyltransferase, partial [Deltaproteobacteria bacterium]|nr:SAM-dependent DNA methyltransferase [Deltaproteobacteria bacterium]